MIRSGGRRSALIRLALVIGSTMLPLFSAELVIRHLYSDRYPRSYLKLTSDSLTWKPGQRQIYRNQEWNVTVAINSSGFRDEEFPSNPRPGSVLVLGDSFTEGLGVEASESYPKQLQALLYRSGRPSFVYNAGHNGTSPLHYLRTYERFFRDRADIRTVVVGFYLANDLIEPDEPESVGFSDEYRQSMTYRVHGLKVWLSETSALAAWATDRITDAPLLGGLFHWLKLKDRPVLQPAEVIFLPSADSARFRFTTQLLRELKRQTAARGQRMLVVLIPTEEQFEDGRWRRVLAAAGGLAPRLDRTALNRLLAGSCRVDGIECLDLLPGFRAAHERAPDVAYHFRHDVHWTRAAHTLAARLIFDYLVKSWPAAERTPVH